MVDNGDVKSQRTKQGEVRGFSHGFLMDPLPASTNSGVVVKVFKIML